MFIRICLNNSTLTVSHFTDQHFLARLDSLDIDSTRLCPDLAKHSYRLVPKVTDQNSFYKHLNMSYSNRSIMINGKFMLTISGT